jgi:hypothetical protein
MTLSEVGTVFPVLLWLGGLSLYDGRQRALPHWASTWPLLIIGLLRVVYPPATPSDSTAWIAGSAVFLMLTTVILSDVTALLLAFSAAALGLAFQTQTTAVPVLVGSWIVALLWTQWGFWGAGDAKVVMILTALWPDLRLVAALIGALFGGGLWALGRRYGLATPAVLWQTWHALRRGQVPGHTSSEETNRWTYQAGVPWLALGTLIYLGSVQWWG